MAADDSDPLRGIIEADETYIGGKWENKPKRVRKEVASSEHWKPKTPVFGMVESGGRIRAFAMKNVQAKNAASEDAR